MTALTVEFPTNIVLENVPVLLVKVIKVPELADKEEVVEEELDEMKKAMDEFDAGSIDANTAADDIVDALIDLCVVAIGTLDAYDIDSYVAWNRVHQANMKKEVGVKASRPNPLGLPDLVKPEGWVAPTHKDNVGLVVKAFE